MAETAIIADVVSRGTRLSLGLYEFGSTASAVTHDANRIAKSLSELSVALKQVGASVLEDDTIPSAEAIEATQEITQECESLFSEIEGLIPLHQLRDKTNGAFSTIVELQTWQWGGNSRERMEYLLGYMDSLRLTLSVMLQAFYAVKIIRRSKKHTTFTSLRAKETVSTEKMQLQALIIEQQMVLLRSSELYAEWKQSEAVITNPQRLLTGGDFQEPVELEGSPVVPPPSALVKYQESSLAHLDNPSTDAECLSMVRGVSLAFIDEVIDSWTRLREFEDRLQRVEQDMQRERRQNQQPSVESDSEDELAALPGLKKRFPNLATPAPWRPATFHRTFSETEAIPIPGSSMNGYQATPPTPTSPQSSLKALPNRNFPISPASSVKSSAHSPRSSVDGMFIPAAATAAAIASRDDTDDGTGLEIPWRLCTRHNFWHYVDRKLVKSNTEAPPSQAKGDRTATTEVLASWVCKEVIEEEGYSYTQGQRERVQGKKTHLEKCFVIERALSFTEVERMVERTIDMVSKNLNSQNAGPKPKHPQLDRSYSSPAGTMQRPLQPLNTQPVITQPASQAPYSPVFVPYLPPQQPQQHSPQQQHKQLPPPPQMPLPMPLPMPMPQLPQQPQQPPQPQYSRSYSPTYIPQQPYQQPPFSPTMPPMPMHPGYPTYLDPSTAKRARQPPSRHPSSSGAYAPSYSSSRGHYHSAQSTSSDTDDTVARKEKERKRRDRERRREEEKSEISGRAMVGTLAKVGGLAALLDGLAAI